MDPRSSKYCKRFPNLPPSSHPVLCPEWSCDEGSPWKSDEKQHKKGFLGKQQWASTFWSLGQASSPDCLLDLHHSTGGDNSNVGGTIMGTKLTVCCQKYGTLCLTRTSAGVCTLRHMILVASFVWCMSYNINVSCFQLHLYFSGDPIPVRVIISGH